MKHFLRISDFTSSEIITVIKLAKKLKTEIKSRKVTRSLLKHKTLAMVFEKPSLRTRVSFETGMTQLGGHAVYLGPNDIQMGKRESVADVVRTLCRYANIITARVFRHDVLTEMARVSDIPVINALSDLEHPCQILADVLTMNEYKKKLTGLQIAFIGDGENNVTHSLVEVAGLLGLDLRIASPKGYFANRKIIKEAQIMAIKNGGSIREFTRPDEAVTGADVVYTDTWVSMGDEQDTVQRLKDFQGFQVTQKLMRLAKKDAIFMHDMPVYRGNEVAAEVIDGVQSVVFDQAENRLHAQKALLLHLIG